MIDINTLLQNAVKASADTMTQTKTPPRFCFPIDAAAAGRLLADAYRVEVEARRRPFSQNADTQDKITHAARWLTDAALRPSLLLYGPTPGTGKTTLARAILRAARQLKTAYGSGSGEGLEMARRQYYADTGKLLPDAWVAEFERKREAVIVPHYSTARDLAAAATDADAEQRRRYDYATRCPFLIIDDLGTEPVEVNNYGTRVTPLLDLLYTRYDAMKPTIITTNFGEKQLIKYYEARLYDRLREMCEMLYYNSEQSYRGL